MDAASGGKGSGSASFFAVQIRGGKNAPFVPSRSSASRRSFENIMVMVFKQATLGTDVSEGERVFVRAKTSDSRPRVMFSLRAGKDDCIRCDVQFDEYVDFSVRPKGRTVHLCGYIRDESASESDVNEAGETHPEMDEIDDADEDYEIDPDAEEEVSDDGDEVNLNGEPLHEGVVEEVDGDSTDAMEENDKDTDIAQDDGPPAGRVRLVAERSVPKQTKRKAGVTITELSADDDGNPAAAAVATTTTVGADGNASGDVGDEDEQEGDEIPVYDEEQAKKRRKKRKQQKQQARKNGGNKAGDKQ